MENEDKVLYTDIVLQLLSAYNSGEEYRFDDVALVINSLIDDEDIQGPGLMSGLLFASIIHMTLLINIISEKANLDREDVLKTYALSYNHHRSELAKLPQLDPEIVNYLVSRYYE
jgi:hypothetical protein